MDKQDDKMKIYKNVQDGEEFYSRSRLKYFALFFLIIWKTNEKFI